MTMRIALAFAALVAALGPPTAAAGDPGGQCAVPENTAFIDGALPRVAKKLKTPGESLTIVVLGSSSALGGGTSGKDAAFPRRLETRLAKAWPKHKVTVVTLAQPGQTAQAMYQRLVGDVVPLKPTLVVLQTGSADAARAVSMMDFGSALERSIALVRSKGSDALLVDSQFSPRASLLVSTDDYRDTVRLNARRFELPLLKRFDTMQYWWSNGVFDLDADDKASQVETADRIHDCIGSLLATLIERGVKAGGR